MWNIVNYLKNNFYLSDNSDQSNIIQSDEKVTSNTESITSPNNIIKKYIPDEDNENIEIVFLSDNQDLFENTAFLEEENNSDIEHIINLYLENKYIIFETKINTKKRYINKVKKSIIKTYKTEPLVVNLPSHPMGNNIESKLIEKYGVKNIYVFINKKIIKIKRKL